jgi:hypothetical protein
MTVKTKNIVVLLILALCVIVTTLGVTKSKVVPQQSVDSGVNPHKRGSIKWFVERAKKQKKTKVVVPPPEESYAEVTDLDDALAQFTVLLVEPIEQKAAVLNDSHIITWNKLKVIEFMSSPAKACPQCSTDLTGPEEMLPMKAGEILVPIYGGSLVVDGIRLESRHQDLGESFSRSRRYLLFLSFDPINAIGKLSLGPYGMFALKGDDQIAPIIPGGAISRDLGLKAENSLTRFKVHLQNRTRNTN